MCLSVHVWVCNMVCASDAKTFKTTFTILAISFTYFNNVDAYNYKAPTVALADKKSSNFCFIQWCFKSCSICIVVSINNTLTCTVT